MVNSILVNFVLSGIDSQCKIIIEVIIRDMEGGNVQRALGRNSIRNTEESIPARRPGWNQNYNQYDKCTSRSNRGNSTSFPIKFVNNQENLSLNFSSVVFNNVNSKSLSITRSSG